VLAEPADPCWRDFFLAQRARQEGNVEAARRLYHSAQAMPAVGPFAQYGLACLGEGAAGAVLAMNPGVFYGVRARARHTCERFRACEIGPDALLEGLQQIRHVGLEDPSLDHFRRLAAALQQRHVEVDQLVELVAREPVGAARRNAIRVAVELASGR